LHTGQEYLACAQITRHGTKRMRGSTLVKP
jgi:hypothetical protein